MTDIPVSVKTDVYGVRILFVDKNYHTIKANNLEEARAYLQQIKTQLLTKSGMFEMLNKDDELVYVCNTDKLIHAMIVVIDD
jgi:hypothetical protein